MRLSRITWMLMVLPFLGLFSCDTSDSINLPDYFVKYYGVQGNQEGVDMIVNEDGTFFLFGNSTLPGGNQKLFLVKADANGNMLWENPKFFGGNVYANQARDIEVASNGNLIMTATSESAAGDNDALLIIADREGNKIDSVKHGYAGTDEDVSSVTQINDGYIITGSTSKIKLNPQGTAEIANDQRDMFNFRLTNQLKDYNVVNNNTWTESFLAGTYDAGIKMIQINNDLFHFFGYSNQILQKDQNIAPNFDFVIYKVNRFGLNIGAPVYAGSPFVNERLTSVAVSPVQSGPGYFLTGIGTEVSGENNLYVAKLNQELNALNPTDNIAYQKSFPSSLGVLSDLKAVSVPSLSSGFFILSNESTSGNQNFSLTKSTNEGGEFWKNPSRFAFGGAELDKIGTVAELPDGKIVMIGTFTIGDDRQRKMTLIKVNKDGKFSD